MRMLAGGALSIQLKPEHLNAVKLVLLDDLYNVLACARVSWIPSNLMTAVKLKYI